ncbi:unnamed protein product [Cuscuta epithymum]|uniref:Myb/SANT-like domain-containing protein n=1 Tax=Cuscuta epithymum TaxID=186058 RepID=A0AAV0FHF4_9ASTE|nr:unnamed protein product [Cuscuta epithymum]
MDSRMPWETDCDPNHQSQSQSQTISQPQPPFSQTTNTIRRTYVKTSMNSEKATWDLMSTESFIRVCVEELEAGNRPGTHFNKLGCDNIEKKFSQLTGRCYKKAQLKNRWDSLKKEWSQWMSLVRDETGLGWDNVKQTVAADEEWWNRKIEIRPEVAKFRFRGPPLVQEQQLLFGDVVATGADAWTPSSGILPESYEEEQEDTVRRSGFESDNTERSGFERSSSKKNLRDTVFPIKFPTPITGKKHKKLTSSEKIARCLEDMVGTMKKESSSSQPRQFTIQECMDVLDGIDGIEAGGKVWMYATRVFLKPNVRELFIAIKTDALKKKWLEEQCENSSHKRSSETTSARTAVADNASCG